MSVDLSFFRSETSQRMRAQARAEARAEDVLRILDRRGIAVPDDIRVRITTCLDPNELDQWFDRSLFATTIADLFADET
ncbi:hypothetical protein ACLMAL_24995 [Nocardia sp. CWNU-33]|uniref:hypothetical protein n=1 Tax=Nocardia sp. CWNU-33 TaxID=3392117 RepID=UPI00398E6522